MSSTTNDTQAVYGSEPTEAVGPSGLTAKRIEELIIATGLCPSPRFSDREMVRRVVDALITSGELRVVKKAKWIMYAHPTRHNIYGEPDDICSECRRSPDEARTFCPCCGAMIEKP